MEDLQADQHLYPKFPSILTSSPKSSLLLALCSGVTLPSLSSLLSPAFSATCVSVSKHYYFNSSVQNSAFPLPQRACLRAQQ